MGFHSFFKHMDHIQQVHTFGPSNTYVFEPNFNVIRLLSSAKRRMLQQNWS